MTDIRSFRDLDAWNAGMNLVVTTYELCRLLPSTEQFELGRQMRRAAISIPSNIAEGHASGPRGRYLYHVRIALGSLAELDTQLELAVRLRFVPADRLVRIAEQVTRAGLLLHGLARGLRRVNNGQ
jgi:four helix bundle protein